MTGSGKFRSAMVALVAGSLAGASFALDLSARQHVRVVGSSTAYPIIAAAAEMYTRRGGVPAPVVEGTGTGGGMKLFCAGVGLLTPDIVMASRAIKPTEIRRCEANGVTDIRSIKIGYDGIVVANARGANRFSLRLHDLYLALANEVPDPDHPGHLRPNPFQRWDEIRSDLPALPIRVLGPPPTSGTRDILAERVLTPACLSALGLSSDAGAESDELQRRCQTLREDGVYVNAGENDARVVRKLVGDPEAVGIIGFNFVDRDPDKLQAATIDSVAPAWESIERGEYPLTRPLYLYVKTAHLRAVPGLEDFVNLILTDIAAGEDGALADQGLIPLRAGE